MEQEKLLRLADVETAVGLKKSKLYSLIGEGNFPRPVKLSKRSVRWKLSDIQKWIANLASQEVAA